MDLQKIAAQANSSIAQRPEGSKEGANIFATPFVDMVRLPMILAGDFVASKTDKASPVEETDNPDKKVERPEKQKPDNNESRQASSRDDSRDDDMRVEKQNDDHRNDSEPRGDDKREKTDGKQDLASSKNDDGSDPVNENDKSGTSGDDDTASANAARDNTKNEANPDSEIADTSAVQDIAPVIDGGVADTPDLDGLVAIVQHHDAVNTGAVKGAGEEARNIAAEENHVAIDGVAKQWQAADNGQRNANAATLGVGDEQAEKQSQQTMQSTLERVGVKLDNHANAAAAKASAEQPVAEQQAKALADTLKSDKPVKIQVNVGNRDGASITQASQSLNANAIAAQEAANGQVARTNNPSHANTDAKAQQVPQARVDGNAVVTPGQTQALNQLAQNNAGAAAESGLGRATTQVGNAGPQVSTHGGAEGVNATAPGAPVNAQQTAGVQRAQQAQAPQTPEPSRPLAHQISVNISKAVSEGLDRISIQLRPDNLGRVEVKLEVAHNGRVNAHIIVDRPETLELLRNDSRNLERALQDAGLDTQSGDLSFNLRDQQENPSDSQSENRIANGGDAVEDGNLEAEMAARLLEGNIGDIISDTRVDIRA